MGGFASFDPLQGIAPAPCWVLSSSRITAVPPGDFLFSLAASRLYNGMKMPVKPTVLLVTAVLFEWHFFGGLLFVWFGVFLLLFF